MTTESGTPAGDVSAPAIESDEISLTQARQLMNAMPDGAEFTDAEGTAWPKGESPSELNDAARAQLASRNEIPPKGDNSDPTPEPAETTDETDPAELPQIERPRSWAKELDEEWASYPREAQEKIAKREQERDAATRRSQNEAAEARKAAEAHRAEADRVKQQYESQLPALLQELQNVNQQSFSDIKSMDDVVKLQAEDPFRFQAWQVHQMRLQAAKSESDRVQNEQTQSKQGKRAAYEAEQNKLLVEFVPEMADPKKASELRERAVKMLTNPDDIGLKDDQLTRWMQDDTGHEILSNAGIQKLIADGLKYRDMLSAPKAIAAKAIPPVQKPGIARAPGAATSAEIQALERKSELTEAEGWKLLQLKAQASRRAS